MSGTVIKVDFKNRKVAEPDLLQRLTEAEEDQMLDDLVFYKREEHQHLLRRACIQGLGLMKSNSIGERDVLKSSRERFSKTPLKELCELVLESDPSKWPLRPNYYGGAALALRERFRKLYKVGPDIKLLMERL